MRYSVIRAATQRMLTRDDAGRYLGVPVLLAKMEAVGRIKPAVRRGRIVLYDVKALDACCDRLSVGDFPE
jgi:hypothetical protein